MSYIENPFSVGQSVVCIRDFFPMVTTTADKSRIGTVPPVHPVLNETLVIDEILGKYLRFGKYDCWDVNHPDYGWRWWKHTSFCALKEPEAVFVEEEIEYILR